MAKIVPMQKKDSSFISGLPLAAFLQMLEQERQTCSLIITSDNKQGTLFIEDGELIDAATDDLGGIEAANVIISWKDATIEMTDSEDRTRKIDAPLTHILLQSAIKQDEASAPPQSKTASSEKPAVVTLDDNPGMGRLINAIKSIPGVCHYYLLNRQGEMLVQSSQNWKMGDFIAYCIVSGSQIRKKLNAKGPSRILITLKTGQVLLIFSGVGMIIALLLKENISADNVLEQLRPALKTD